MRDRSWLVVVLLVTIVVGCSSAPAAPEGVLQVRDLKDGDSFVASDGVEYRVGMVNTPEVGECHAAEATAATAAWLADGFTVEPYATDGNGRTVARVATDEGDLGVLLARRGHADDRYLDQFRHEHPAYAAELDEAFAAARSEDAGLWGSCPGA